MAKAALDIESVVLPSSKANSKVWEDIQPKSQIISSLCVMLGVSTSSHGVVSSTETAVPTGNGQATGGLKGCSGCEVSVRQAQSETR